MRGNLSEQIERLVAETKAADMAFMDAQITAGIADAVWKAERVEEAQHAADLSRLAVLHRELGMLQQAQPHLKGCPASQNLRRIQERQEEVADLEKLVELHARLAGV